MVSVPAPAPQEPADYKWRPITPLSERERGLDLASIKPLYEAWHASKKRLLKSSPESLREFNSRLIRRMSVETGILEHLYDLDRGTTEALVVQGFVEELVSHSSTNLDPSRLIDILRDQEAAVQLVIDCVAGNRELTKSVIHELHSILTRHQDTTMAVDTLGNRFEIALLKGKYKEQPNNPKRPDGTIHEYCPPVHVESEMENLLSWLSGYVHEDPIVVSAWLHHRFTQIHPYQDGNGRVARVLTTLVLLRSELLPLVVDRDLRLDYIKALESADACDLEPLATIFATLERTAVLQALSVDADKEISYGQKLSSVVIDSIAQKLRKRREAKLAELKKVNRVALALRGRGRIELWNAFNELKEQVSVNSEDTVHITEGGPDHANSHWYRFEVGNSAKETGKFANLAEDHYFIKASVRSGLERLVFVTSFHHVGRELSGIMEATAFCQLESFDDSEDRESVAQNFFLCSVEPFVFTYKTRATDIQEAFSRWLDTAVAVAIKEFGDKI